MSVKVKNVMDVNKYAMVIRLFLHEKSLLFFIYELLWRCAGFHK